MVENVGEVPVCRGEGDVPVFHEEGEVPVYYGEGEVLVYREEGDIPVYREKGEVPVSGEVALVSRVEGAVPAYHEEVLAAHGKGEEGTSAAGLAVPSFSCLDCQTLVEVDELHLQLTCLINVHVRHCNYCILTWRWWALEPRLAMGRGLG